MIYVGGVLKDANVDLSRVFQFSAVGLVLAALTLLTIRPKPSQQENAPITEAPSASPAAKV
jgi:hypothetical protein